MAKVNAVKITKLTETDKEWERITFSQEGYKGFTLYPGYLKDFVSTLEEIENDSLLYFYQNKGVHRKGRSYTIVQYSGEELRTLLQLDASKMKKMIKCLRESFPSYL